MRPGLVLLGVAFGVIGGGLIVAVNLLTTSTTATSEPGGYGPLAPHRSIDYVLSGPGGGSGRFSIVWSTSAPVEVVLSTARCDPSGANCSSLVALARWDATASGQWAADGTAQYPLLLAFTNDGNSTVDFRFLAHEEATVTQGPSLWMRGLADAAGATLLGVGGVAVFLGLFLRSNPYGPPPPLVSQSADDARFLAGEPDGLPRDDDSERN